MRWHGLLGDSVVHLLRDSGGSWSAEATLALQLGAVACACVALVAVALCGLTFSGRSRLRDVGACASLLSGALAIATYMVWRAELLEGEATNDDGDVVAAVTMLASVSLAASAALEILCPVASSLAEPSLPPTYEDAKNDQRANPPQRSLPDALSPIGLS